MTTGSGRSGAVTITASDTASITNNSTITTSSSSPNGDAGAVSIIAAHVILQDSNIFAEYSGDGTTAGSGGAVTVTGIDSVALARLFVFTDISSVSKGNGGAISITAPSVTLEDSTLFTDATADNTPESTASGGAVTLNATTSISLTPRTLIDTETFDTMGDSGPVTITAPTVMIVGNPFGSTIDTSTHNQLFDPHAGNGGDIEITGTKVTLTDFVMLGSFADSPGTFSRGGDIRIIGTQNLLLDNGAFFLTSTTSQAPAGNIELLGHM